MFFWIASFAFAMLAAAFLLEATSYHSPRYFYKEGRTLPWLIALAALALSTVSNAQVLPQAMPELEWDLMTIFIISLFEVVIVLFPLGLLFDKLDANTVEEVFDHFVAFLKKDYDGKFNQPPILVQCNNNGITALVRWENFQRPDPKLTQIFGMPVIQEVMLFGNSTSRYLQSSAKQHLTGNLADLKALTKGCEVRQGYGWGSEYTFFVPFSSEMADEEWAQKHFPHITLREAYRLVHGNRAAERINPAYMPSIT